MLTPAAPAGPFLQRVLRVVDDGPGIPADLREQVFERFAAAIVASVVAAHQGGVEVESAPGRTVFTVRLPRSLA